VENLVIQMARSGQLRGKVGEQQFIDLLEQINQQSGNPTEKKVVVSGYTAAWRVRNGKAKHMCEWAKIDRRRFDDSDSEEDYNF
jgi:hypothetical protein